jgi:hypothetical protein
VYWKADTSSVGRASGCQPELLFVASVAVRMLSERIAVASRPSDHPMRLRPEKRRFRKMAYSMRSLLNRQLKPRRVSLFDDPGHERNPGLAEPMRESSDVFITGGETRGLRRGE